MFRSNRNFTNCRTVTEFSLPLHTITIIVCSMISSSCSFVIEHNDKRLLIQSESFYQKPIVRSSQIERKLAIFAAAEQIGRKRWWLSELYPAGEIWRKHRKTSICLGNNQFVMETTNFGPNINKTGNTLSYLSFYQTQLRTWFKE